MVLGIFHEGKSGSGLELNPLIELLPNPVGFYNHYNARAQKEEDPKRQWASHS